MLFKYVQKQKEQREEGFTIIEMTVTMAIVLIITLVAVAGFRDQKRSSVDGSVSNDLKAASVKIETWKISNPGGAPDQTLIEGDVSDQKTRIALTIGADGSSYILKGTNPAGKRASTVDGIVFDSLRDGL